MDARYLTSSDWRQIRQRYPAAMSFMVGASLRGELAELRRSKKRAKRYFLARLTPPVDVWNPTREARLAELEEWHRVTTARMSTRSSTVASRGWPKGGA